MDFPLRRCGSFSNKILVNIFFKAMYRHRHIIDIDTTFRDISGQHLRCLDPFWGHGLEATAPKDLPRKGAQGHC